MSSSSDFKAQLTTILAQAKEQGLNLSEVFPSGMLDHFKVVTDLQNANEYIRELEAEAKEKNEKKSALEKQLRETQQRLSDLENSATMLNLQLDLKDADLRGDLYRNVMKDEEARAERYRQKWEEAEAKITKTEDAEKKMKRFQKENQDLLQSKARQAEEMDRLKAFYDNLREKDLKLLERKEKKHYMLECKFQEKVAEYNKLIKQNDLVEAQYQEVVSSLDIAVADTAFELEAAEAQKRSTQQHSNVTYSEIQPLHRFYAGANKILYSYQDIFKQLLNVTDKEVKCSPDFCDKLQEDLSATLAECEAFHILRAALVDEGVELTEHHHQLSELSKSADEMQQSLAGIASYLVTFLWGLQRKPNILTMIRRKLRVFR